MATLGSYSSKFTRRCFSSRAIKLKTLSLEFKMERNYPEELLTAEKGGIQVFRKDEQLLNISRNTNNAARKSTSNGVFRT